MQLYRHQITAQEIDHELIWLLVSLGAFLGLALWFAARFPTPQCVFHALTGLPCVTCGATRSAFQFLHGHYSASLFFNPLAFLAYCSVLDLRPLRFSNSRYARAQIALRKFFALRKTPRPRRRNHSPSGQLALLANRSTLMTTRARGHGAVGAESGLCCNESVLTDRKATGRFPPKPRLWTAFQ